MFYAGPIFTSFTFIIFRSWQIFNETRKRENIFLRLTEKPPSGYGGYRFARNKPGK